MAQGQDTGRHRGRRVDRESFFSPQNAVAAGMVNPTSKGDMDGMHGPSCNNCGSYNTDASSDGGHDCYDCGHTSNPSRPAPGSPGPDALQNMFRMG